MPRNPQFANDVDVKRKVRTRRDFVADRDPAARQRQNEGIGAVGVDRERRCEQRPASARSLKIIGHTPVVLDDFLGRQPSYVFMQVALGGSGSSGTNFVGFCEKLNMSPIEVEVSSVV